ncbi:MAG TPA: dTDP-4-dehydrorhamnose reductase [Abditibacteriaceae bacterium]|nr:dTDP-4-dehydrorhamnose reductase [Abditibacteriaceae bacterium]
MTQAVDKRVLVTGARGQLARALLKTAPAGAECIGMTRAEIDITDEAAVHGAITRVHPDLVINGAAYNLVDKAEADGMQDAFNINALGVARLSRACREVNIPLVHFSTDFVFDGEKRTPYTENDRTAPLGVYGASKLAGENIALAGSSRNFAIRVCRLYGPTEPEGSGSPQKPSGNFALLMLRLARERGTVRVVNDQVGTPTYTPDLAAAVWQLLECADGGLFQLSNAGEVAFDEYAREIFRLAGVECAVEPISSQEYSAPARRPLYSTLSNQKASAAGVIPLRHWRDALAKFIAQL